MADQNPLDPLAARLDQIIDSFREAALEDELVTIPVTVVTRPGHRPTWYDGPASVTAPTPP
ncbi:MAG: hypothetical protein JO114_24015 [Planctomycetaceae bacterium]|nr:hypothetical protein [Planctomycetaceae bacterium]